MSSRRRSSRRPAAASFPQLPAGVQAGLTRIVSDHKETVAKMLECDTTTTTTEVLVERCAAVMKQQQLSVSQFLARFFDASVLQQHAIHVLEKSGKGTAAVLGERIEAEWRRNNSNSDRKRSSTGREKYAASAASKKTKTTKPTFRFEAELTYDGIHIDSTHETCQEAAQAAWDFILSDDPPGWVLSRWLSDDTADWRPQFIGGFVDEVAQKGFFKVTNGSSIRGTNYMQITQMDCGKESTRSSSKETKTKAPSNTTTQKEG